MFALGRVTRQSIEAENYMVAVERLDVWCNLAAEVQLQPDAQPEAAAEAAWPSDGAVQFREFSVRCMCIPNGACSLRIDWCLDIGRTCPSCWIESALR